MTDYERLCVIRDIRDHLDAVEALAASMSVTGCDIWRFDVAEHARQARRELPELPARFVAHEAGAPGWAEPMEWASIDGETSAIVDRDAYDEHIAMGGSPRTAPGFVVRCRMKNVALDATADEYAPPSPPPDIWEGG